MNRIVETVIRQTQEHGFTGLLICLGIVARLFLSAEPVTLIRVVRLVIAGAFTGALMALALESTTYTEATKGAIIGIAALLSEDLLIVILAIGEKARENPGAVIRALLSRWSK